MADEERTAVDDLIDVLGAAFPDLDGGLAAVAEVAFDHLKPAPRYEWVTCSCGKVRQTNVHSHGYAENGDAVLRLARISLCRTCEMEFARNRDACPQGVAFDDDDGSGVSACSLAWCHEGRCVPHRLTAEELAEVRANTRDAP